jgi:5-methyltetrahydropteroyltriglutamate--homocysteine methyltransferase
MTIRSDVVGSLLRPPALLQARESFEAGRLDPVAYKLTEDQAVDAAVRLQEAARLDVITDGEQRRYAFFGHLIESLDGFDKLGGWAIAFHNDAGEELKFRRPVVVERLRWRRSMCAEEFTYLRARATCPLKATLVSTQQAAAYYDPERRRLSDRDAYLADVVDFTRREVRELVRLGCTYIRSTPHAALLDPVLREGYRQRGAIPTGSSTRASRWTMPSSAVILATFGLHICAATSRCSREQRLSRARVHRARFRFLLEYDDERPGGFEPARRAR